MNTKLLLKTIFMIVIALLLVIMGMHNTQSVELKMPELHVQSQKLPAAFMYIGFFAVGLLSGTVLTAGKKSGSSSRGKSDK
jgi:uncharacterized integral membrane protein